MTKKEAFLMLVQTRAIMMDFKEGKQASPNILYHAMIVRSADLPEITDSNMMGVAYQFVMEYYDPSFIKREVDFKKVSPDHSAHEDELW